MWLTPLCPAGHLTLRAEWGAVGGMVENGVSA